jgi:peptide/nickel transport system substrate-binding protein
MTFDRGKAESAIYDEAYVPSLDAYLSHFKGVQVTSTDPLTIVTYDDLYFLDAEYIITTWWPQYGFGDAPWQTIGLGVRAETAKLATFSTDKASVVAAENEAVEWMSFIAGPSLDILRNELTNATAEVYIPYAPTMGEYVTAEEAALRYDNTLTWYREQGHFWLGTGPFFLNKVFPIEQTLTLARYEAYPDTANKWGGFGTALVATVELDGPGTVTIGQEVTFDVFVSFGEEPYPVDQIAAAKYLLFDATGALVAQGDIEVSDAMTVTLSAEVTNLLAAGANKLEVAVTSKAVSIPAFAAIEFITQ